MAASIFLARSRRVLLRHGVYVRPLDGQAPLRRMVAENISLGGMFVRHGTLPPPGTLVSVDLEVHGLAVPFAEGEVLWYRGTPAQGAQGARAGRPTGFAVRFLPLTPRAQALLEHLVERSAPVGGDAEGDAGDAGDVPSGP